MASRSRAHASRRKPRPRAIAPFALLGRGALGLGASLVGFGMADGLLRAFGLGPAPAAFLAGLGLAAGVSLAARRARAASAPSTLHLRAVERVSHAMDGVTDPDHLAGLVVHAVRQAVKPERAYVWLPMREKRDFYLAAQAGPEVGVHTLPEAWLQEYFEALSAEGPTRAQSEALARWMLGHGLTLCVPIVSQGRLVGALMCAPKAGGKAFTAGDRWMLSQTVRQAALALSYLGLQKEARRRRSRLDNLASLYRDAKEQAITDGLTGLSTRAYLQEMLAQRVHEAKRHQTPLAVILLDVDHFKRFNDRFGHIVGDTVLKHVAAALKEAARTCDTAARYGGEELALVLPQTDLEGALVVAERIRESVEGLALEDAQGRRLPPVTVSVGVAELALVDTDELALLARADAALYEAKGNGRNQVALAS